MSGRGYGPERWAEFARLPRLDWDPARLLHDFTEYTPKPLVGREHRAGLRADPRVLVVVNATAATVQLDGDRVTGVQVMAPDGAAHHFAADDVVLAAGAVENARLLQLSDPAGVGLGTGREHTGRYLQDHPIIRTAQVLATDYRILQDRYVALHRGRERLFPKVRLAPAVQEEHGLGGCDGGIRARPRAAGGGSGAPAGARRPRAPASPNSRGATSVPPCARRRPWCATPSGVTSAGCRPPRGPRRSGLQIWPRAGARRAQPHHARQRHRSLRAAPGHGGTGGSASGRIETSRRMTRWVAEDLDRLGVARLRELPAMHDDDAWRAAGHRRLPPVGHHADVGRAPTRAVVDANLQVHGVAGGCTWWAAVCSRRPGTPTRR